MSKFIKMTEIISDDIIVKGVMFSSGTSQPNNRQTAAYEAVEGKEKRFFNCSRWR